MNAVKSLEAELKLLRWHKLANESSLKAAILKDKQIKRNDGIPRLLNDSKIRLNAVIEDERSKDLITDEAFVKKQEEYERKNEEAARRQLLIQTNRLHSIQMKADHIQMLRARKQRCLQIEAAPARHEEDYTGKDEQTDAMEETTKCQVLVESRMKAFNNHNQSCSNRRDMLMRSQSSPAVTMTSHLQIARPSVAHQQTELLEFTKRKSKSGPGVPSRPYYCVRISQSEKRKP